MPRFAFWHTSHDAILWAFDREPNIGEEVVLGDNVFRVTGLRDRRLEPTAAVEYTCELVRAATDDEVMEQVRRGVDKLPPPPG